jgi:hypothetical protein
MSRTLIKVHMRLSLRLPWLLPQENQVCRHSTEITKDPIIKYDCRVNKWDEDGGLRDSTKGKRTIIVKCGMSHQLWVSFWHALRLSVSYTHTHTHTHLTMMAPLLMHLLLMSCYCYLWLLHCYCCCLMFLASFLWVLLVIVLMIVSF